jgi:hypothetical protein
MARISTVKFRGGSGEEYDFEVWPFGQAFNAVGAVYVVTRRYQNAQGKYNHEVLYVGETEDLSTRFDGHHKAACFARHKADCICTHRDDDGDSRLAKEDDLVKRYDPDCND